MQNSPQDLHKKILGRSAEGKVCKYLKKRGYKILKRNFVTPFGEADIVAKSREGYICFVEVKARENEAFGLPAEGVTRAKEERYRKIARYYCSLVREEVPARFDVAAVREGEIDYIENAFI